MHTHSYIPKSQSCDRGCRGLRATVRLLYYIRTLLLTIEDSSTHCINTHHKSINPTILTTTFHFQTNFLLTKHTANFLHPDSKALGY